MNCKLLLTPSHSSWRDHDLPQRCNQSTVFGFAYKSSWVEFFNIESILFAQSTSALLFFFPFFGKYLKISLPPIDPHCFVYPFMFTIAFIKCLSIGILFVTCSLHCIHKHAHTYRVREYEIVTVNSASVNVTPLHTKIGWLSKNSHRSGADI